MDEHTLIGGSDEAGGGPAPLVVLVVDDDELVRWSTVRLLRGAGYEVLDAAGVDEALICMEQQGARVSLVLSDVIMPGQSGYELGREVRTHWPHAQVVLISGYTPVAIDRHGIDTAGFRLVRKPVADLPGMVAEVIGPARVA